MHNTTDLKIQLAAAWLGPICIVGYIIFWGLLGHNIPPPSSGWTAKELADNYFNKYHSDIMLGMVGCAVVAIFYVCWASQMSVMMRREEHSSPILSNISLLGGGITAWLLAECPATWADAASYSATNPDMAEMLWRQAWYIYMLTYMITTVEMVACGVYALIDKSVNPIFPKWSGWFAIGGGLCFIPDSFVPYFNNGPFALNGLWDYYVTFGWWLAWFIVYSFYMIRFLSRQLRENIATPKTRSILGQPGIAE